MKCQYCDRPPVRACLLCGVFYCAEHGEFKEKPVVLRQALFMNSVCQECKVQQFIPAKRMMQVFGMLGAVLTSFGFVMTISLQRFLPGGIFLIQGSVFLLITMVFAFQVARKNGSH